MKTKMGIISRVKVLKNGVLVHEGSNLIHDTGFDFICNSLAQSVGRPNPLSYIAIGTGTTAADMADVELETEIARQPLTYSHTAGENFFTVSAEFGAGVGTGAITESGVCNAATGGIFIDRLVFAAVNKGASDTITFHYEFEFTEV